jgi:hypothetical protein
MVIIAILLRRLRVLRSDASIWVGVTRFSQLCVPLTDPSPGARGLRQIRNVSARATARRGGCATKNGGAPEMGVHQQVDIVGALLDAAEPGR